MNGFSLFEKILSPELLQRKLQSKATRSQAKWSAFTAYAALDAAAVTSHKSLYHHVLQDYSRPIHDGNNVLISLSPEGDPGYAPPDVRVPNRTQAERRLRPRLRRAAITFWPPLVAMRARKPWRRLRTSLEGWKVRFDIYLIPRCAALLGFVLWGTRALMDNVSAQEHAYARLRKPDVGGL